jgi:hypothetical protein
MSLRLRSVVTLLGLILAAGAGVAALPPGPAAAGPICPVLPEPTEDCPDPPPPPGMRPRPLPPNPAPNPTPTPPLPPPLPGSICLFTTEVSNIAASDRPSVVAYGFRVGAEYCVDPQTQRITRVTPIVPTPIVNDSRVSLVSGPSAKDVTTVPPGTSVASANVFYQLDVEYRPGGSVQRYHHEYGLRITTMPLRVEFPPPVFR